MYRVTVKVKGVEFKEREQRFAPTKQVGIVGSARKIGPRGQVGMVPSGGEQNLQACSVGEPSTRASTN